MTTTTIPITFDKSHLTTIGTRLYAESLDLVRELVANAYDADATRVSILLSEGELSAEDDGSGMDREGLTQYFTIGSHFKKTNPVSSVYKRQRIGEFGIGKFAVLSLCDRFSIFTRKDTYAATVVFDKAQFEASQLWEIPVIEHPGSVGNNGTRVTLTDLRYPIGQEQLERRLRQQLPLGQKDFSVWINGAKLTPHTIPGHRYRIREQTAFGPIGGDIIVSSLLLSAEQEGIAVRVKGMMIQRDYFGLDKLHELPLRRITGDIAADFLPLTSARDNFLKDTPEFATFLSVIQKKMRQVAKEIKKSSLTRQDIKTDQTLSNALQQVKQALRKNPDIFLMHDLPLLSRDTVSNSPLLEQSLGTSTVAQMLGKNKTGKVSQPKIKETTSGISDKHHRNLVKTILKDKHRLIKKLKIGGMNLVCSLSHLGETEVESFVEGGIIFINRDHPLFVQTAKNEEQASYHLLRLITQELVKLANPPGLNQAYDWQSRLLTDALVIKSS